MNRGRVIIAILSIIAMVLVNGCGDKNNQNAIHKESVRKINSYSRKSINFNTAFGMLNDSKLFDMYSNDSFKGLPDKSIQEYVDNSKQKFFEVTYKGNIFPKSLVSLMERVLYNKNYDNIIKNLDTKNYRVDRNEVIKKYPRLIDDYSNEICDIYQINLNQENQYYLIVVKGGSAGNYYVYIKDCNGKIISQFELAKYYDTRVIKYDNNYYYVCIEQNFNFGFYDSIEIYKLETNGMKSLRISFIPKSFGWETVYNKQKSNIELSNCISGIKDDLVNGNYIDRGKLTFYPDKKYYDSDNVYNVYKGDETKVKNVKDSDYKIDLGNTGFPVYFSKGLGSTGTKNMSMHLTGEFYLYDSQSKSYKELSNLNLGELYRPDKNKELMQMWFKVINKKVYIFRIFHLMNYCYILDVSLIENGKSTQVRNDVIIPQNSFTMVEGKQFHMY